MMNKRNIIVFAMGGGFIILFLMFINRATTYNRSSTILWMVRKAPKEIFSIQRPADYPCHENREGGIIPNKFFSRGEKFYDLTTMSSDKGYESEQARIIISFSDVTSNNFVFNVSLSTNAFVFPKSGSKQISLPLDEKNQVAMDLNGIPSGAFPFYEYDNKGEMTALGDIFCDIGRDRLLITLLENGTIEVTSLYAE
ncbi:MAG TPA: hypothetical protein VLJ10_05235 [Candidatus Bathyarchaeia archaeon]|nr:hypothetical protein [Candidatus Bathyarchaeia archaeon]